MMNEILPLGGFLGTKASRFPALPALPLTFQAPQMPTFGVDSTTISFPLDKISSRKPKIEPIQEVSSLPHAFPQSTDLSAPPVPTVIPFMDDMEKDLKYWLPYDEADSIASSLRNWADTRDETLQHMEGVTRQQEGEINDLQARQVEIDHGIEQTDRLWESASRESDAQQSAAAGTKREIDSLSGSGGADEIKDLENKIARAEGETASMKGELQSLRGDLSNARSDKDKSTEKNNEKISKLEGEISGLEERIRSREQEKKNLELKKQDAEKKLAEEQKEADEKRQEKARIEKEIDELENQKADLGKLKSTTIGEKSVIDNEVDSKKAELERIHWIIADFEFKTSGKGL
jgi:chromosome segregation ATPase